LALAIAIGVASAALAETDVVPGQTPPAEQNEPAAQPAAKPEPPQCIKDESGFRTIGERNVFMFELTNHCEQKLRCTARVYILNSHGPVQGQTTLILEPKSKGPGAHKTHAITVKSAGGMANMSRECKVL
jgi:hypothetical protein